MILGRLPGKGQGVVGEDGVGTADQASERSGAWAMPSSSRAAPRAESTWKRQAA